MLAAPREASDLILFSMIYFSQRKSPIRIISSCSLSNPQENGGLSREPGAPPGGHGGPHTEADAASRRVRVCVRFPDSEGTGRGLVINFNHYLPLLM